jgi:hypothetical protein
MPEFQDGDDDVDASFRHAAGGRPSHFEKARLNALALV